MKPDFCLSKPVSRPYFWPMRSPNLEPTSPFMAIRLTNQSFWLKGIFCQVSCSVRYRAAVVAGVDREIGPFLRKLITDKAETPPVKAVGSSPPVGTQLCPPSIAAFSQRSSSRGALSAPPRPRTPAWHRARQRLDLLKERRSVRRVARFLKSSARSRCSPRTFAGKFSIGP